MKGNYSGFAACGHFPAKVTSSCFKGGLKYVILIYIYIFYIFNWETVYKHIIRLELANQNSDTFKQLPRYQYINILWESLVWETQVICNVMIIVDST